MAASSSSSSSVTAASPSTVVKTEQGTAGAHQDFLNWLQTLNPNTATTQEPAQNAAALFPSATPSSSSAHHPLASSHTQHPGFLNPQLHRSTSHDIGSASAAVTDLLEGRRPSSGDGNDGLNPFPMSFFNSATSMLPPPPPADSNATSSGIPAFQQFDFAVLFGNNSDHLAQPSLDFNQNQLPHPSNPTPTSASSSSYPTPSSSSSSNTPNTNAFNFPPASATTNFHYSPFTTSSFTPSGTSHQLPNFESQLHSPGDQQQTTADSPPPPILPVRNSRPRRRSTTTTTPGSGNSSGSGQAGTSTRGRGGPSTRGRSARSASRDQEDAADDGEDDEGSPGGGNDGAAEDDKRSRNTQASARFRAKKKQHVLNLQRTVNDLQGRIGELEQEEKDLKRENGWLKEMIIMKTRKD